MIGYFDNTPLAQDTYCLCAPFEYYTENDVYTPHSIATWNYGNYFEEDSVESLNMWLHEMCHVIELYHSNKKERLLMNNFGYEAGIMTIAGVKMEAWVISLQHLISKSFYGRISENLTTAGILDIFNGRGVSVSLFEWEALLAKYTRIHKKKGLTYYYETWQKACEYVKENR